MKNIIVTLTLLLDKEMSDKEIQSMFDNAVLKEINANKWTVMVEDAPNQTWDNF